MHIGNNYSGIYRGLHTSLMLFFLLKKILWFQSAWARKEAVVDTPTITQHVSWQVSCTNKTSLDLEEFFCLFIDIYLSLRERVTYTFKTQKRHVWAVIFPIGKTRNAVLKSCFSWELSLLMISPEELHVNWKIVISYMFMSIQWSIFLFG